jgi:hypothetical protein
MSITELIPTSLPAAVTFDLYRDIHKGIRAELFAVVGAAGRLDPADGCGRADLAAHIGSIATLLETHAEHEDAAIQPAIEQLFPAIAEQIETDHLTLDGRMAGILARAEAAETRAEVGWVYLDLASFTSAYLAHQDLEERELMPALEAAIGPDATLAIHQAIVGSIPPDVMGRSLAVMLPAMNVDDRTELLGGIRAGAPEEVFAGIWGLARSVLDPADAAAVARRLGL